MIKRAAVCILCMMMFCVCVNAESIQSGTDAVTEQQTMPQNSERPAGGRGGMGGMQPPNGERPPMPADGEMPQRPEGETTADKETEMPQGGMGGRGSFGGMMQPGQNTPETESTPMTFTGFLKEYQTPIISVILLALAFVFVIFYKRKRF